MQRTEYEAAARRMHTHRAPARVVSRAGFAADSLRVSRLVLAGLFAVAVACWVAAAQAEEGAASATAQNAASGASPSSGAGPAPAPATAAPQTAAPVAAGAAPAAGSDARDAKKVAPTTKEEGTDEDAATLPEPEDGKPPRGASGPPPAPRGPSAFAGLPTVLPSPTEAGHIDEVEMPVRAVAVLSGRSTWDDGFKSLFDSFEVLASELAKAGIKPTGRPVAVFLSTDESGFSFDAMAPVASAPADTTKIGGGVRFDQAPAGKAIRFTHKAPYEEIDTTYEAITAYLDSKNIAAEDAFIEEYVTDPADPSDGSLQINIYVQPKKDGKGARKLEANPAEGPADKAEPRSGSGKTPQ